MNNRIEYRPFEWVPNDFSLKGTDEKSYTLEQFRGLKGLVVMFICNHCPYVKAIINQLVIDVKVLKENGILPRNYDVIKRLFEDMFTTRR